ncbi:MAG: pantoate--beta-alanine ligase [Deltaproteobacteria bacterium]|nr:pantoate--beta-alanine ligase [Deltaproteobacteria bacterium]
MISSPGLKRMEVIEKTDLMQQRAEELRLAGKVLGFVPTMGFFHEGHLELMRVARKHSDVVIISIFVNPMQFGPKEDLAAYPRDPAGDLAKARQVDVDIAFVPAVDQMYPEGFESRVSVEKVTKHLCGLSRPTHFDGVTTIVAKLFNIVKPHLAVFGQKDYQQLTVISRMVKDLNMDLRILGVPTYREQDGLAMSSRNSYLNSEERKSARCLKKSMDLARERVGKGETRSATIKKAIEDLIRSHPYTQIDYINLCDPVTLDDVDTLRGETLLALAVRVGKTRLIDNCVLGKAE